MLAALVATGCTTLGRAVVWPVEQSVLLATDITAHTVKTTVSLGANTVEYAVKTGLDATVGTAAETAVREATEAAFDAGLEDLVTGAVQPDADGTAAAVLDAVLHRPRRRAR
jgi:hypothetical protein